VIATDKETGKIVWDRNLHDQPDLELTAAPLALKDSIIVGASGGDRGVRDWVAALDPKTGNPQWKTYSIRRRANPAAKTWKDKNNAWQTGGGAFYVTGSYDPATNLTYWGSGNPVPGYDASYRSGRQSLHGERTRLQRGHPARSPGISSTRPTTTTTTTRPAPTS